MLNVESILCERLNKVYDIKNRKMNDENKSMLLKIYQEFRESFMKSMLFINFHILIFEICEKKHTLKNCVRNHEYK